MAKTDTKKPKRRTSSTETLRAPPINPAGRLAAQTSGALQQVANSVVPNPAKLLSGDIDTLPIGDWLLGDTTGMLDRWSKGRAPITFPAYGSKLVNAKFDPAIIDALSVVAPGAKPAVLGAKYLARGAKSLAPDIASMAEHYALPLRAYAVPPEEGRAAFLKQWGGNRPVQRASIKELQESVRQARGNYGAQRVERAADEIPNLEQQYTQTALERAFTESNPQALMIMRPKHFEEYAEPLPPMVTSKEHHQKYINDLSNIARDSGFSDVPYLNLNRTKSGDLQISGHEGRHRMRALDQLGDNTSLVRLFPRESFTSGEARRYKEDYIDALIENLGLDPTVNPEIFPDVKLPMPEVFAGGGIVKAAGKGLRGLAEKYRLAHELAQKNAALPVSKGGLGLPPDNTALDRAKALGFDIYNKYFHGTGDDFTEFDPNSFFTSKPHAASTYAEERGNTYAIDMHGDPVKAANVMPVHIKTKKVAGYEDVDKVAKKHKVYDPELETFYYTSPNMDNFSAKAAPLVIKDLKKKGFDAVEHYDYDMDGNEMMSMQILEPNQIRSTNAAFDPFRRNEADILAGVGIGLPVTGLIDRQEPVKKAEGGAIDYDEVYEFRDYGNRETGEAKDTGALGEIRMPNGRDVMTEYAINVDGREMPSIVEGMHPADVNYIRETGIVPRDAQATAIRSANKREARGLSPFWNKEDGYAKGGEVDYDKHYEFVQHTPISSTIDHDAMYMFR